MKRAVTALEGQLLTAPADAETLNDLAALRLTLAGVEDSPLQLLEGLEAALRARETDPAMPEAAFNLGLALERTFLWHACVRESEASLPLIRDEGFRREVRRRLARCRAQVELLELASKPRRGHLDSTAAQESFRHHLDRWARARAAGENGSAREALEQAGAVARTLATRFDDPSFLIAVQQVESAADSETRLVEALGALGTRRHALESDCGHPDSDLNRARRLLSGDRGPLFLYVEIEMGECLYYTGDYTTAASILDETRNDSREAGYSLLAARASWIAGTTALHDGALERAHGRYREGLEYYEAIGDGGKAAFLRLLIALSLSKMSLEEEAWSFRLEALEERSTITRPDRLFTLFQDCARALEERGHHRSAIVLRDAQVEASRSTAPSDADLAPISLVERARSRLRLRRIDSASDDLDAARELLADVPEVHSNRHRIVAKLRATEAELHWQSGDRDALALAREALEYFDGFGDRSEDTFHRLDLLTGIAAMSLSRGDRQSAVEAIEEGVELGERLRSSIRDPRMKVRFLKQFGTIADQVVTVALDQGDAPKALLALDRFVNRLVLDDDTARYAVDSARGRLEDVAMEPGTAVLVVHALPDRLARWLIRGDGVTYSQVALERQALLARLALGNPDELFELLIPPAALSAGVLAILPVGPLARVSFGAIRNPSTGALLLESHTLFRLANLRSLWLPPASPARRPAEIVFVVARTDPESGPLASVEYELSELESIYPEFTVAQPSELRAASGGRPSEVLHFAGHAYVDPVDPFRARLGDGLQSLTFLDILGSSSVTGTTVVLAACKTAARGLLESGEDASLATAFLSAGADRVVASLGDVVDEETAALSIAFHRRLASGMQPAEALRDARLENRRDGGRVWRDFTLISARMERAN